MSEERGEAVHGELSGAWSAEPSKSAAALSEVQAVEVEAEPGLAERGWFERLAGHRYWLLWGIVVGSATVLAMEIVYYTQGGCHDERKARDDYGHQISNQMCCHAEWAISGAGMTVTGLLCLMGCPLLFQERPLSFGRCCCCPRWSASIAISISLAATAFGLATLAIFQMCWVVVLHGIGAAFFFGGGFVLVCILNCSARCESSCLPDTQPEELEQPASVREKPLEQWSALAIWLCRLTRWSAALLYLVCVVLYMVREGYMGEWFAVGAIAVAVLHLQLVVYFAKADQLSLIA